ncbi:MAG TPA: aspartate kinase, partial [Chlamydiales bacterium]|nr:aspartate kinase [Chlamydiales bacterium]
MGRTTDELIALAKKIHPEPPQREYDMLVSVGERISMALLAMCISKKGDSAVSFTGSQSGIITTSQHAEAKIVEMRPRRLLPALDANKIVIVAGFQGMSLDGEITTLGRGGSDTTAVALGVCLDAERVEFYKDVPGIFSHDPKKHDDAELYTHLSYDAAIDLTGKGAKVLHQRCLILAKKNAVPLKVLSFKPQYNEFGGTVIENQHTTKPTVKTYENES